MIYSLDKLKPKTNQGARAKVNMENNCDSSLGQARNHHNKATPESDAKLKIAKKTKLSRMRKPPLM